MGKSFSKFNPRKINPTLLDPIDAGESHPEHDLSHELPFSTEEAASLLERVRESEEKDVKITSLKQEVNELKELLDCRNEALGGLINELSALNKALKTDALDKILLGADDIIRKAISDKIPGIIEKRIQEIQSDMVETSFYASRKTCDFLKLPIISNDDQIPDNIIKCLTPDGSEFIIEVDPA